LVLNPPVRDAIVSTEFFRDTIVAAVAPNHPLAGRKNVALAELGEFPFVKAVRSFGVQQQIDRVFDRCAITPTVYCVTNSLSLIRGLAGLEGQCALLPRSAVAKEVAEGTLAAISIREFADDPVVFSICVHNSRLLSPAAKVLVDGIVEFCQHYRY
jgi:DNA-binding transcriptional LysR family regulator